MNKWFRTNGPDGIRLTIDLSFGPQTDQVVRRFQEANSLQVDGVLGRRTWAALLGQSQTRTKPAEHRVGVVNDCFHARSEPKLMILACADAGFRSFRLEWGEWSARHAIGRGVFRFNDCDPACVVGTLHRRVGRIVLREPQFCKSLDRRVFMSGRVIFDRPFKGDRGNPIGPGCPSK